MDLVSMINSPLAQAGRAGSFLRLVLAESAAYGMPGSVIVVLDDIAAMLGLYEALPEKAATHVAGPLVNWRTHPQQPSFERIHDVEKLAYKQRALVAFGGGPPGQMVGTAEIVIAMGNLVQGTSPPDYYEVFQWASLDVLQEITGHTAEQILADPGKKHWRKIPTPRSCSLAAGYIKPTRRSAPPSGASRSPPWETTPTIRGPSCSRLPSSSCTATRKHGPKRKRQASPASSR